MVFALLYDVVMVERIGFASTRSGLAFVSHIYLCPFLPIVESLNMSWTACECSVYIGRVDMYEVYLSFASFIGWRIGWREFVCAASAKAEYLLYA